MNIFVNILFDILILIFSLTGILTSFVILFLIFHHRHQYPINTSILLLCNTYLSIILTCLTLFDMFIYNLYSIAYPHISFNNWWCYSRAYLQHVGLCLIYYSYLLQACFRFTRIIFYQYKKLIQSIRFMFRFIFIQWLMAFILILPNLLLRSFEYASPAYHCLILYPNFLGLLITTLIIFYFPIITIGSIYFYIIYYMRQIKTSSIQRNRQRSTERDIIVLHRIVILVGMLLILSIPAILLWLGYIITGYFYPFSYHLQWLTFAFSLSILSIVSIFLTPQLQELLFKSNRSTKISGNNVSTWTETYELKTTDV